MLEQVDQIVVLMLESRSFDHVLGHLSLDGGPYEGRLDGLRGTPIDGRLPSARYENSCDGRLHYPFEMRDGALPHGIEHDRDDMRIAMGRSSGSGEWAMNGFVRAYFRHERSLRTGKPLPMGFLRAEGAPVTSFLARNYAICDRWFAPLPVGSTPNRLFAASGYSRIADPQSGLLPQHRTVFDWMRERGVRFRVYHDGLSFFTLCPWMLDDITGDHFRDAARLAEDVKGEADGSFPQVIFVEPSYFDAPRYQGRAPNDNHPRVSMAPGERFLRSVYEALTSNPERFQRTLFIVTYASPGGFYDHASPLPIPSSPPPGAHFAPFESTGLRVPAIVVSPLVEPGTVFSGNLDHTSILQLIAERFGDGAPYSEEVLARKNAGIGSASQVLNRGEARLRAPVPPEPRARPGRRPKPRRAPESKSEQAFVLAARALYAHAPSRVASVYPDLFRSSPRV